MVGNQLRLVLFDLGGVLIELTGMPVLLSWAGNRLSPDEMWVKWLKSPAVRAFETGRIGAHEFSERLVSEMELSIDPDTLLKQFTMWPRGPFPGALELVNSIPARYKKAILSNCNCLHWPRFMDEMGLAGLFDLCFSSHLIGKIKPDEDPFAHVIEETGCKPSEILFLDDNRLNVETADRLGIRAAQVNGVSEAEEVLLEAGIIDASSSILASVTSTS